jgi:hypothetical protein
MKNNEERSVYIEKFSPDTPREFGELRRESYDEAESNR